MLGHGLFERSFGGDPAAVGRTVNINNHPMTIVGVAPPGFNGVEVGSAVDIYVPLAMQQELQPTWGKRLGDWRSRWLTPMARLKDGVSQAEAQAEANLVYAQLLQEDWAHIKGGSDSFKGRFFKKTLSLLPGGRGTSGLRDQSGTPLVVLMGMVGMVLLIACANVASLLLTRATSRQKETAVRLALGASRLRLVRLQLVESVTLSLAGGLVGLQLAYWVGEALIRALPFQDAARTLSAAPDLRVGCFTLALAVVTGVAFGLVPALRASQSDLAPALKSEATAVVGGGGHFRLRKGLVVAQVALSLLLLIGAGLFTRSLMNLRSLDPGFKPDRLFEFDVDPARSGQGFQQRVATLRRIQEELTGEPGVASASAAGVTLMSNSNSSSTVRVDGYEAKEGEDMNPGFNYVAPGFFETLGIPLVAGRDLADGDRLGAPRVAVVNEVFAKYYFKNENPVGRRFGLGRQATERGLPDRDRGRRARRQGRLAARRAEALRVHPLHPGGERRQPDLLRALERRVRRVRRAAARGRRARRPDAAGHGPQDDEGPDRRVALRRADGGGAVGGLRPARHRARRDRPLRRHELRGRRCARARSACAWRSAPTAARCCMLVLRDVAMLASLGIAIGLPGGYGLGKVVESQLFGLHARDPLTFAVATLALVSTAFVAGLVPALRAARVDPMTALRYE